MTTATVTSGLGRSASAGSPRQVAEQPELRAAVRPLVSILAAFGTVLGIITGLATGHVLLATAVGLAIGLAAGAGVVRLAHAAERAEG